MSASNERACLCTPAAENNTKAAPALDLLSLLGQPLVTIVTQTTVAPQSPSNDLTSPEENQPIVHEFSFDVHKNVICPASPFFFAAFNGQFIEGQTQKMTFQDINPSHFELLIHWLYTGELKAEFRYGADVAEILVKLWEMAERFLIPTLQNQIVDELFNAMHQIRSKTAMRAIINAIGGCESAILNSMLLNCVHCAKGITRDLWVNELWVTMLREFAKSNFDQSLYSTSKHFHAGVIRANRRQRKEDNRTDNTISSLGGLVKYNKRKRRDSSDRDTLSASSEDDLSA
ncbi:hypothetical protein VTL71DRAFT_1320 [Oculimacula yallundae]|uniref:BTB domain-containing protein n=1 Tax=Oculimacula yallundae TaxID=86028 RepID=A0ABR4CAE4_9HELO